MIRRLLLALTLGLTPLLLPAGEPAAPLKVLFLGDRGHHRPADRAAQLTPVMAGRGIEITYTEDLADLNPENLAPYDALIVYANTTQIEPDQEKALLDYVAGGGGFVPIHCASYCFLNSPAYIALVGAQFLRHGTGEFDTQVVDPDHPITKALEPFRTWDETYVHTKHNEDRHLLQVRVEGDHKEPWTWVRTHGKGRVFYTAYGHDDRTWGQPGFHDLIERGIRWAAGKGEVSDSRPRVPAGLKPFAYAPAKIPNYIPQKEVGSQSLALGEPIDRMQQPVTPDESMRHMVVPRGFEVRLFAAEPDVVKPITMAWDHRGRLWVAESVDYPNDKRSDNTGRDRIKILEDTDGDGRADRFTVFAEGLNIPTSLAFANGGVVVHQAPETLFLKDTDGDDRADVRKVLLTGWGTRDTHAGPSNLRWGLDNWLWGIVGYSGFRGDVGGEELRFSQGLYRFMPDGSKLEFLRSTSNNSWGVGFSEEGLVFGSTANNCPSVFLPIPNRSFEKVRGGSARALRNIAANSRFFPITDRVRQVDFHGNFTAAAGHALYTARTYPPPYWNRTAFVSDPTGHLTATFTLHREEGDFTAFNGWNLLASADEWTAPIAAEVGPDGHVWVIDWYNFIVQHNPTPKGFETGRGAAYETPLRDQVHGRIYRIVYREAKPTGPKTLDPRDPKGLVAALKDENQLWRMHAQRLLVERGWRDVVPDLIGLVQDRSVDAIGLNPAAIHALWTLHGLGALDGSEPGATAAAVAALQHPSAGVRRNALQVLPHAEPSAARILAAGALQDEDAQVRLAALLALADGPPSEEVAAAVAEAILAGSAGRDVPLSRAEAEALARMARRQALPSEAARGAGAGSTGSDPSPGAETKAADGRSGQRLAPLGGTATFAGSSRFRAFLQAPEGRRFDPLGEAAAIAAAVHDRAFLRALAARTFERSPNDLAVAVAERVAEHHARGVPADSVGSLLVKLEGSDRRVAEAILAGLARGWPKGSPAALDDAAERAIVRLLPGLSPEGKGQLASLASRWGSTALAQYAPEIAAGFLATARDETKPERARIEAAQQLIELRREDAEAAGALVDLITPRSSPLLAAGLVEAVGQSEAPGVGAILAGRLPGLTPGVRPAAIGALLGRGDWTTALLDQIEAGRVRLTELALDQQQALAAHPDKAIAERANRLLARGGGLPNPDRQKVIDDLARVVLRGGDAARGKAVFQQQCAKCHAHSGEGGAVGPDLTGMAAHPREELLIQILDPGRSVEGNFVPYAVATADGRVLNGLLASETRTAIELLDAEGKSHVVPREEIDEMAPSEKSLMPEGFEQQIPPEALADLLAFLTARGQFLPLDLGRSATIVGLQGMVFSKDTGDEQPIAPGRSPQTFDGVPFQLVNPEGGRAPNAILLYGPEGTIPPRMPRSVSLPCNAPARAIHLLGGLSRPDLPLAQEAQDALIVRLHYADGQTEDHPLRGGSDFPSMIRPVEVPGPRPVLLFGEQRLHHLMIRPQRDQTIARIELAKGRDETAPIVLAATVEVGE